MTSSETLIVMLSEPTLVTLSPAVTAVVRHRGVTMATLRPLFDSSYTAVGASGATPIGPAFALYRGETSAEFDLELGYPVDPPLDGPVAGQVTVDAGELPSGEALALTHVGAYGSLHESWGRLDAEARRRGLTPAGMLEVYVTQPTPDTDPTTLRTNLFLLLE